MRKTGLTRSVFVACAVALLACGALGCDRIREFVERMTGAGTRGERKAAAVSDRERILSKFGEPNEKIGVGKAVHTEHGIRYNRKWNYYYSSGTGESPFLRTVYFMNDAFTGSVVRRPDGTIIKEKIRFAY